MNHPNKPKPRNTPTKGRVGVGGQRTSDEAANAHISKRDRHTHCVSLIVGGISIALKHEPLMAKYDVPLRGDAQNYHGPAVQCE
jgi:hypothetical protein